MSNSGNLVLKTVESGLVLSEIQKAAMENDHSCLYATHYVEKDDEIVGAFSISSPTVYWWMHTEKIKGRDSYRIGALMTKLLSDNSPGIHYAPIQPDSPYYPLMDKLGYKSLGNWEIFYKVKK